MLIHGGRNLGALADGVGAAGGVRSQLDGVVARDGQRNGVGLQRRAGCAVPRRGDVAGELIGGAGILGGIRNRERIGRCGRTGDGRAVLVPLVGEPAVGRFRLGLAGEGDLVILHSVRRAGRDHVRGHFALGRERSSGGKRSHCGNVVLHIAGFIGLIESADDADLFAVRRVLRVIQPDYRNLYRACVIFQVGLNHRVLFLETRQQVRAIADGIVRTLNHAHNFLGRFPDGDSDALALAADRCSQRRLAGIGRYHLDGGAGGRLCGSVILRALCQIRLFIARDIQNVCIGNRPLDRALRACGRGHRCDRKGRRAPGSFFRGDFLVVLFQRYTRDRADHVECIVRLGAGIVRSGGNHRTAYRQRLHRAGTRNIYLRRVRARPCYIIARAGRAGYGRRQRHLVAD